MNSKKTIIITGGAGFIGSAVIRYIINNTDFKVVNVDKLTYSGNLESLDSISQNNRYSFVWFRKFIYRRTAIQKIL